MSGRANLPTDRTVFQNAWVVPDVEAACLKWADELGVGPFFVTEYRNAFADVTYRGEPAQLDMTVALAQAGPTQVELIQPHTEICAYRDSVAPGELGFHHVCVWTYDIDADTDYLAGLGYPCANAGRAGDTRFAYYDTRPLLGAMLEVVTPNEGIKARFAQIAEAAENWDGSNPIR